MGSCPKPHLGLLRECALLALLLLLLVPVELLCAQAAFQTLGDIDSSLYWALALGGNSVVLLVAVRSRVAAAVVAMLLGLGVIPYQVILMQRHAVVQAEAARIVAYAYEANALTGSFPPDLSGYTFQRPEAKRFIQEYRAGVEHGGFQLLYRVGTKSTSHWYSPRGGWSYYPD